MSSNASAKNPVCVPAAKKAELYRLTNPPVIAWPTLALMLFVVGGVIGTDAAALQGALPLWGAMLLNVVFMYPVFHVAHDAMHRSASSKLQLGDQVVLLLGVRGGGPNSTRSAERSVARGSAADLQPSLASASSPEISQDFHLCGENFQ